jgi:hypothetical protein
MTSASLLLSVRHAPSWCSRNLLTRWYAVNGKFQLDEDGSQSTSSPQDHELEIANRRHRSNTPMEMIPEVDHSPEVLDSIPQEQFIPSASTALVTNGYPLPTHSKVIISHQHANMNANYPDYDVNLLNEFANFEATMASWSQPPGFDWDFTNSSGPLPLAADIEKWNVSDSAFLGALELCRTATQTDPILDPDVPVKAILWGWHTVDAAQRNHPVWQALRQVDERVFGSWTSKAQKIAMMYVCQLMMQVCYQLSNLTLHSQLTSPVPLLPHERES